jgi:amidophosphoribosyltransferase
MLYSRGQESAGIVTSYGYDAYQMMQYKGMGLVGQVFKEDHLVKLKGNIGIGNVIK